MLPSLAIAISLVIGAASAQAQAPDTAAGGKQADKPAAKKATRNVSGTVRSASPETVVVAGRDKGKDAEWTFAVEPTTNIRKGSKSITAGGLKAGDAVQVRYRERDGKALAESILVKAPRKDTKKAESK
jgi:hypothetical protein